MPLDTCNHYTPYAGYCQNKQKRPSIFCYKHQKQHFAYDKENTFEKRKHLLDSDAYICTCGHSRLNHHYRHPFRPSGLIVTTWRRGTARCSTCKRHNDFLCGHARKRTKKRARADQIAAFHRIPWSRFEPKKWMQKASKKMKKKGTKGALHRMLHIPMGQKIPTSRLRQVLKSPRSSALLKKRAQFALNVRGTGRKTKSRHQPKRKNHRKNVFDKFTKKDWDTYKSLYLTAD